MERQLQRIFQQGFQYAVSRRQESWVYRQRSGHFLHMSWRATGEQSSQRQGWLFPDATELASRPVKILADGEGKKRRPGSEGRDGSPRSSRTASGWLSVVEAGWQIAGGGGRGEPSSDREPLHFSIHVRRRTAVTSNRREGGNASRCAFNSVGKTTTYWLWPAAWNVVP